MDVRQYDSLGHPWSHRYRELWGAVGGLWGAVGSCGGLWGAVGGFGGLWGAVGSCGGLWGAVGGFGELWEAVGSHGEVWRAVGSLLFQVSPSADVETGYVVYCSQQGDGSCVV